MIDTSGWQACNVVFVIFMAVMVSPIIVLIWAMVIDLVCENLFGVSVKELCKRWREQ